MLSTLPVMSVIVTVTLVILDFMGECNMVLCLLCCPFNNWSSFINSHHLSSTFV